MAKKDVMIFAGNANISLAESISRYLDIPLGKADVGRFSDGEIMEIGRASCRERV